MTSITFVLSCGRTGELLREAATTGFTGAAWVEPVLAGVALAARRLAAEGEAEVLSEVVVIGRKAEFCTRIGFGRFEVALMAVNFGKLACSETPEAVCPAAAEFRVSMLATEVECSLGS